MRAAPAFELDVTPCGGERAALAAIGGLCAATLASWLWSHAEAAAGPAGRGTWPWLAVGLGAALIGLALGWKAAPRSAGTLAWRHGVWTLRRPPLPDAGGAVQAKLDFGSWMLLCFQPSNGGPSSWVTVNSRAAGPAWHALRATLFGPGIDEPGRDASEDARS